MEYGQNLVDRTTGRIVHFYGPASKSTFIGTDGRIHFYADFDTETEALVAVIENGKPRPNSRPYIHTTVNSAEKEARRLSVANPGQEFAVFQRVSVSRAPVPVATTVAA
jgi:hypothetical protein